MPSVAAEKNVVTEKLELLRSRAAIRAVDVANMLGTTPETVSRWNQGRPTPDVVRRASLLTLNTSWNDFRNFIPTQGQREHGCTRGISTLTAFGQLT